MFKVDTIGYHETVPPMGRPATIENAPSVFATLPLITLAALVGADRDESIYLSSLYLSRS